MTVKVAPQSSLSSPTASLVPHAPVIEIHYPPSMVQAASLSFSALASFIANQLDSIFAEEQATLRHLMLTNAGIVSSVGGNLPVDVRADLQQKTSRRTMRSMKYAPTYHLTFSLLTPEASPSNWEIEEALEETVTPLLHLCNPCMIMTDRLGSCNGQIWPALLMLPSGL